MSVADYLNKVQALHELRTTNVPECWAIIANSVYARAEYEELVALFDTKELASAYIEASRIPAQIPCLRGYYRSFRPDSVLWNFNNVRGVHADNSNDIVVHLEKLELALLFPPAVNPPPPDPKDLTAMNAMLAEHALVHG